MDNVKVHGIFPTPVYFTKLDREISKEEFDFVNEVKNNVDKNEGNYTSKNSYILEEKPFNKLKDYFDLVIHDYFTNVMKTKDVVPYITQSWLNYTKENEYHHVHTHPNSIVSGVFYFDADIKNDSIKFWRNDSDYKMIKPEVTGYNVWNSESWFFNVGINDLVLFPSNLKHSVSIKEGKNTRISLAFNTFIKGKLGTEDKLSELKL